jgi:hypothetical protein
MKNFTKMMGVMMVVLLSFTFVLGQSLNLETLKVNQETDLTVDTYDGVKPIANPNEGMSNVSFAKSNPAKSVLWDNGTLVTHPGGGFGGANASVLQSVSGPALTTYGFGAQQTAGNSMAEDFTVDGTWTLDFIKFFAYQTGSTQTSTITGIYVQIWDAAPNAGGTVIWGDLTTNKLSSTTFSGIYRSIETNFLASDRPIMEVAADVSGCVLSPGTYWVQYQFTGSLASGPWAPPISIWDQGITGNALQYTSTGWAAVVSGTAPNTYAQGLPFIIEGTTSGPSNVIFEDNFDTYTAGGQVACQNPTVWTTWSLAPCGSEDAYVSSLYSHSSPNSAVVVQNNDLVKDFGDMLTSGKYKISFYVYIPTGKAGYFNTLQKFTGSQVWGLEVYFNLGGAGSVNAGGTGTSTFTWPVATWFPVEHIVDLNNDWSEIWINGNLIQAYQWSIGAGGTGQNTLEANDFFGATANDQMFFDDYVIEDISPSLPPPSNLVATVNGYNVNLTWNAPSGGTGLVSYYVYRNGTQIATVTVPTTLYNDLNLPVGTYNYYVKGFYGPEGLSAASNTATAVIQSVVPPAPTNLVATGTANGVQLTWDAVGAGQWIHWDAGVNNGNGIGLTSGGTLNCASHWVPADLINYIGFKLQKVQFWPNGDPAATYVIKVWGGVSGTTLLYQQNVTSFVVDQWNEVVLTTPVTINTADDFWFGYSCTHGAGTFPAGCDDGPAVQGKGDMISTGGAWVSMSAQYGLDYNWNIAGFVAATDGKNAPLQPMIKTVAPVNYNVSLESAAQHGLANGPSVKFNPGSSKDFLYNVYWKFQSGTYTKLNATPIAVTNYLHTTPVPGWNYYVVRTVLNGVESLNSNEASILITSIDERVYVNTQVYPNPASSIVNISSEFDIQSVRVYNHAGQAVANENTNTKFYQFDASQFTPGLYLFQIETAEGTITKRIIIE